MTESAVAKQVSGFVARARVCSPGQTACAATVCSYAFPPHSHCYNSTLFIVTGPSTDKPLRVDVQLGCVWPLPRGLRCGWVHSFDWNLQRHEYCCCQNREALWFIAAPTVLWCHFSRQDLRSCSVHLQCMYIVNALRNRMYSDISLSHLLEWRSYQQSVVESNSLRSGKSLKHRPSPLLSQIN